MRAKRIRTYLLSVQLLVTAALLVSLGSTVAYASERNRAVSGNFHIRQESTARNGVLVSRPHNEDKEIFDFIVQQRIYSLEDYSQWLQKNVRYQSDGNSDDWDRPLETAGKGSGDCEDYAFLSQAVLRILGYEAKFIGLFRPGKAHAICVFKKDGRYMWFDNGKLMRTNARSFEELARFFKEKMNYKKLAELDPETRVWKDVVKRL